MSDIRVADTAQLQRIASAADMHQYGARLDRDLLSRVAPDGKHVITVTCRNHHQLVSGGLVAYHRTQALVKLADGTDVVAVTLDVSHLAWADLTSVADALAAQGYSRALN